MKKIIAAFFIIVVLVSFFLIFKQSPAPETQTFQSTPTPTSTSVNIKASFTIITENITRNFSAEKYHNQSSDVYIEKSDPSIVNVNKVGITWSDFFKTLPMELTKECLITGDGETLCTGQNGTLKFYLNNVETPDLLDQEIINDTKVSVIFK